MAVLGAITLNEITLFEVDGDPRVSPVPAPIGSFAYETNTGRTFTKTGAADTAWEFSAPRTAVNIAIAGTTTTTSTSDVLLAGLTSVPPAGDYEVSFHSSFEASPNNGSVWASIYVGGTKIAASEIQKTRGGGPTSGTINPVCISNYPVTVNGSQAIEIRWRVSGGTGTSSPSRALFIRRVG